MTALTENPPTYRQASIFDFIREFKAENGYAPSVRQIGEEFGIRSPNGVMCHLHALERKGLIRREPLISRGIVVLADEGADPRDALLARCRELLREAEYREGGQTIYVRDAVVIEGVGMIAEARALLAEMEAM